MNISCGAPAQPNQTPMDVEAKISEFIEEHPSYGQVRIANELKRHGVTVGTSASYNVLRRHDLSTRPAEMAYAIR